MVVILLLVPSSSSASLTTSTYTTTSVSSTPARYHLTTSTPLRSAAATYHYGGPRPFTHQSKLTPDANRNYSREYVNHVTRINISNDYSQVEGSNGEPEPVVKEGEWKIYFMVGIFCDIRGSKGEKENEKGGEGVESLRGFKSFRIPH